MDDYSPFVLPTYQQYVKLESVITHADFLHFIGLERPTHGAVIDYLRRLPAESGTRAQDIAPLERALERYKVTFRTIGIPIHFIFDETSDFGVYDIPLKFAAVEAWFDRVHGLWPYPAPSSLPPLDQEDLLDYHHDVAYGRAGWKRDDFSRVQVRKARLRVIVPAVIRGITDDIADKNGFPVLSKVKPKDFADFGLGDVLKRHYNDKPQRLFEDVYPWLWRDPKLMKRGIGNAYDHHPDTHILHERYMDAWNKREAIRAAKRSTFSDSRVLERIAADVCFT